MSAINDLIDQIEDKSLRERIRQEVDRLNKQKKFGLVFEEHIPECTPLYEVPVKKGSIVAKKTGKVSDTFIVTEIKNESAICVHQERHESETIPLDDLVTVARFGDPIYPYLQKIDSVCNAPDSDLWHTLIEADNYHALQLLAYLYPHQVDCIYIDPPYNKPDAKDWKYNNNYVDASDKYRHSKWLSMMQRRLKLAKRLLNPKDSVLIVTIDEKEYLHLGCLLEEMFPEAEIQMVSITINPSGAKRDKSFSRADEYAFITLFGDAHVRHPRGRGNEKEVRWWYLRRTDYASRRGTVKGGVAQFYPIYVDSKTKKIVHIGDPLSPDQSVSSVPMIKGAIAVFPIREDGVEMNWGLTGDSLQTLINEGVVRVTDGSNKQPFVFRYLSANYKDKIASGRWAIRGLRQDGTKIVVETEGKVTRATTVWQNKAYDAGQYGTSLVNGLVGSGRFSFPKSLYSVRDTINFFLSDKPNALIVDFFAGSGTTLHAVNLLNAVDGGQRRCIMVTNNEVSESEARSLSEQGYKPGDAEWEKLGIARYVTWPRTVCSIEGHDVNGNPLSGNYGTDVETYVADEEHRGRYLKKKVPSYPELADMKMSDGFRTNAIYFKLGFVDKNAVALGRQFRELLPILWMKSGAVGACPELKGKQIPDMLILPDNHFAALTEEAAFKTFAAEVKKYPQIESVYIITDSLAGYREMIGRLRVKHTYQLYRDYLDNFRINHER